MDVLTNLTVVVILQYIKLQLYANVSNHRTIHLKLTYVVCQCPNKAWGGKDA